MNKIILILLVLLCADCFRSFRLDKPEPKWVSEKPILAKTNLEVEAFYFSPRESEVGTGSSKRLTVELLKNLKRMNLFQEVPTVSTNNTKPELLVRVEFTPGFKSFDITRYRVTAFFTLITLGFFPVQMSFDQQTRLIVKDETKEIYNKVITEKMITHASNAFLLLGPFFENYNAYDRLFYENTSILFKDFYEFYTNEENLKKPLKPKGK